MKKYPSKISYGLLIFIMAILIGTTIPMLWASAWVGVIINFVLMIFILHLFYNTYYLIDGNFLIVKSGFVTNKKIDLSLIAKISESNSLVSSPAASLDRLEIIYDETRSVLISPKDKTGFISHLTQINPEIEVRYK